MAGFGTTAGVLAIAIHNLGSCTKLFYEAIESIDERPLEAIDAIGSRKLQTIAYGVVPQVMPSFLSTVMYLWEYNFRASQVLGIVGAGGIGLLLNNAIGLYDWPRVGAILLLIIVMVALFDGVSFLLRNKLLGQKNLS
jgi:phosphonate transport system permease protein